MQSNLSCLKCLGRSNQEDVSQSTGTAGAGLHGDDPKCLPLGVSSCRAMPASCATHRGVRVCQVCHRQANGRNTQSHLAQVGKTQRRRQGGAGLSAQVGGGCPGWHVKSDQHWKGLNTAADFFCTHGSLCLEWPWRSLRALIRNAAGAPSTLVHRNGSLKQTH